MPNVLCCDFVKALEWCYTCVQSNEEGSSVRMEKEGFIRSLEFLEASELNVGAIVTDHHPSIEHP